MSALDQTLILNPNHLDALSAKGTFLVRLPRLLGGDTEKGEQLLRRVIREEPTSVNARLSLAKSCEERGDHEEAVKRLAQEALDFAVEYKRQDFILEAKSDAKDPSSEFIKIRRNAFLFLPFSLPPNARSVFFSRSGFPPQLF